MKAPIRVSLWFFIQELRQEGKLPTKYERGPVWVLLPPVTGPEAAIAFHTPFKQLERWNPVLPSLQTWCTAPSGDYFSVSMLLRWRLLLSHFLCSSLSSSSGRWTWLCAVQQNTWDRLCLLNLLSSYLLLLEQKYSIQLKIPAFNGIPVSTTSDHFRPETSEGEMTARKRM